MSDLLTDTLEVLWTGGNYEAEATFQAFLACAKQVLPEPLWIYIPTYRAVAETGGVWTASVKWFPVVLFKNLPGYVEINANFEVKDGTWRLKHFSYFTGMFSGEARLDTLQDAVLLSRSIAANKNQQLLNHQEQEAPSGKIM